MKHLKIIVLIIIFTILNFSSAYAADITYETRSAQDMFSEYKDKGIEITGSIPQVTGGIKDSYRESLNSRIKTQAKSKIDSLQGSVNTRKISFSFQKRNMHFGGRDYASIVVYANIQSNNTNKIYKMPFNINIAAGETAYIDVLVGDNYQDIITNEIKSIVTANPDKYSDIYKVIQAEQNGIFPKVTRTQPYYIENGSTKMLTVLYYDRDFSFALNNVVNLKIKYIEPKQTFDLKTAPLRTVAEHFGYNVSWSGTKNAIEVKKGWQSVTLRLNVNKYQLNNNPEKTLDYAPLLKDSVTLVPLSFFEQMLGINYSVDTARKEVLFSSYKK